MSCQARTRDLHWCRFLPGACQGLQVGTASRAVFSDLGGWTASVTVFKAMTPVFNTFKTMILGIKLLAESEAGGLGQDRTRYSNIG